MKKITIKSLFPATAYGSLVKAKPETVIRNKIKYFQKLGGSWVVVKEVLHTSLGSALTSLDPLSNRVTRLLVIETSKPGWVMVYTNWLTGWFVLGEGLSRELKTDAITFKAVPHVVKGGRIRKPGAATLQLCKKGKVVRLLSCIYDRGWRFGKEGKQLPIERSIPINTRGERFTISMALEYLNAEGIRPFDDDFFIVDREHPARSLEIMPVDKESAYGLRFTPVKKIRSDWGLTPALLRTVFERLSTS